MKFKFEFVFETEPDGSLRPIYPIRIGTVEIAPGVLLPPNLCIEGLEFGAIHARDLEADYNDGVFILRGYY